MYSMTGYGHSERSFEGCDVLVDIRTVNGRYFDFKPRLGRELLPLQNELKELVHERVSRGRVELTIDLRLKGESQLELNVELVENYLEISRQLNQLGVSGDVSVAHLLTVPGVVIARTGEEVTDSIRDEVFEVVEDAVESLVDSRRREGQSLLVELRERLGLLRQYVSQVEGHTADIAEHYREKLSERVRDAAADLAVDDGRLTQEIIFYVERSDISEELARLYSHIDQFEHMLGDEFGRPVGKKLDFLCQELNREGNTLLAKAAVAAISEIGVELKALIEAIREQVQNVE
ncbi:MAG: YicC family protein [Acidobacteriota bacterium]|nr:MAG: YicC family protein [Acidobacteriota bacterium]